jgi:very-short-patch-repair endonuclease
MQRAGELRKALTPAEARLWARLRDDRLGVSFRRQHALGPYIADFCCVQKKLVVELDGSQHLAQQAYDAARTAYLEGRGYTVIRFWNRQVMEDVEAVLREIMAVLGPPPGLPPKR